ncbi:heme peroxidase [Mucidula mucida]|nr:heme peroxidase [Mucidula mucida]
MVPINSLDKASSALWLPPNITMCLFFAPLVLLWISSRLVIAYVWPDHVMDELEHLLVDTQGFNDGTFKRAITPCSNYVSGAQNLGRETAAQWIRVSFHDFATANVAEGTGGLDASIQFETDRAENSGAAMNDSMAFFAPFANAYVSMADLMALSVVISIAGCSDPPLVVPLRGGRIDATEGGATGVPEPETLRSVASVNNPPAKTLTACGHSMGSVHHAGFPQVVNESAITPDNLGGGIHFDATPDVFDDLVVHEYLNWQGQKGGALVTTENVTVRSDLRIYAADSNATMQQLAASPEYFKQSCVEVFGRMLDTVPAGVQLTDAVQPLDVKPVNVSLTLDSQGDILFSGYVRFSQASAVSVSWLSRNGSGDTSQNVGAHVLLRGGGIFGQTFYHGFSASIPGASGISAFIIHIRENGTVQTFDNAGQMYALQDVGFLLSDRSTLDEDGNVLTSAGVINVSANLAIPTRVIGSLGPRINHEEVDLASNAELGAYTLYSGAMGVNTMRVEQTTVDLVTRTEQHTYVDEFRRFNGGGRAIGL